MQTHPQLHSGQKPRMWLLILVALAALGLASCGSDDDSGDAAGGDGSSDADSNGSDDTAAPGDDELDRDASLRLIFIPPSTIDPHRQVSIHEFTYTATAYDRLVHVTPEGEPVPGLAESWEFSDDGTALTFHLREGAVFHDGSTVDAEAVKASLERGLSLEGSTVAGDLSVIESIEAVDEVTVQLNLSEPNAALPLILSFNHGAIMSPAGIEGDDLENDMIGAGPYEMVEYVPGTRMVFERFDDYWDPEAAKLQRIEITINSDSTAAFNALRSGQADVGGVQPQQVEQAEGLGLVVNRGEGLGFHQFQMNRTIPPFDDVLVRQALNHAIDGEAIFNAVAFGLGSVSGQPFPEGYWAYNEELGDPYPYDPDRARELLADAGYPDGFEVDAVTPLGTSPAVAEAVKAQLEEVGITVNLQVLEGAQFAPTFFGEQVPVGIYTWTGRPDPRQTFGALWADDGFANPGRHSTPEFMEALEAASVPQEDQEAEREAIREVSRVIMEQALAVPIFHYFNLTAHTDQVVGIDQGVLSFLPLRHLGMTAGS